MTLRVIGIDIGLSGALAVLGPDGMLGLADMPRQQKGQGTGTMRFEIDARSLDRTLRAWSDGMGAEEVLVVVEAVAAFPGAGGDSASSMLSLGDCAGVVRGIAASRGYQLQTVHPSRWKKHYGLVSDKTLPVAKRSAAAKEVARAKALTLFPSAEIHLKKHHNRAEALLIARYGWEQLR